MLNMSELSMDASLKARLSRDKKRILCGVLVGCDTELGTISNDLFVMLSNGIWDWDKRGFWCRTQAPYRKTRAGRHDINSTRDLVDFFASGKAAEKNMIALPASPSTVKLFKLELRHLKRGGCVRMPTFPAADVQKQPVVIRCPNPKCRRLSKLAIDVLLQARHT